MPSSGDLPNPGIEPMSPASLALREDSLPLNHQGSPKIMTSYFFALRVLAFFPSTLRSLFPSLTFLKD